MKLKASVDYGVRAILYMAVRGETCSSREISEEMSVPRDYLIQLALRLRKAGLVKARPGKNGGYVLGKDPADITIGQVLDAFDNDLKHSRSPLTIDAKPSDAAAMVYAVHGTVMSSLDYFLGAISIKDLLDAYSGDASTESIIAHALRVEADRLEASSK